MQTTLAQYNETQSTDSFSLQNSKLLKVRLDQVTIQGKLGSMVAYQGDVKFEHAGSGGLGRMLKKAVTGEGQSLMKMSGAGEVFLADTAQDIHLVYLEGEKITVNGAGFTETSKVLVNGADVSTTLQSAIYPTTCRTSVSSVEDIACTSR